MQQFRRDGRMAPSEIRGHRRAVLEPQRDFLLKLIEQHHDITLEEVRTILSERGVEVCVTTIWGFYDRCGISFKKKPVRGRAGSPRRGRGPSRLERSAKAA
jgi:transposase